METSIDILNELTLLSPAIAGIDKVNVFNVPEGYFDSISKTVLICLQEEYNQPAPDTTGADIPDGYFDNLASSILKRIKAIDVAKEEIMALSPLLHDIQNKHVFEVPDGYFDSIQASVFNKINTDINEAGLDEHSPLLSGIRNKNVFQVPENYFTNLPAGILKKVHPSTGKIMVMPGSNLLKYAVAAMLTVALSLGLYKYIDHPSKQGIGNITVLASLDPSIEKGKKMDDRQFNESMQNLTEADIARYLENNGDITDLAVLRNNMEGVSLPSEEDYLLDGAALDKYLNEIDKPATNN